MTAIKISSKIEAKAWRELQLMARESHQSIAGLLTEAVSDYLRKRRIRPDVVATMDRLLDEHAELARLLAR
jgi:hypothetical protein